MTVQVVVEGDTDLPFVRKLVVSAGMEVGVELDMNGKYMLDEHFAGFNAAAQGSPWLVVRDLDDDAPCGGAFVAARGIAPARWMVFRLAVREVEAWALADRRAFAEFFGVRLDRVPADPDAAGDPTRVIVELCRSSGRRRMRQDMVPLAGGRAVVGPLYEATLIEFGRDHWDVVRATSASESLRRARSRLIDMAARWTHYVGANA